MTEKTQVIKELSHSEAVKRLDSLQADIESIREERVTLEVQLAELDSDENSLKREINSILDAHPGLGTHNDLTGSLPFELWNRGFTLISYSERVKLPGEGGHYIKITTELTNKSGDVIKEWVGAPTLGQLFDIHLVI